MKIIYLHQYFKTPDMAGGTRSYEMARRLVAWGHEVHVITSRNDRVGKSKWFLETIDGIKVHWLNNEYDNRMGFYQRIKSFFRFAFFSAKKAAMLEGDVVFATSTPLTIALPGVFSAKRNRCPMIFEVRDLWPKVPVALGIIKNPILVRACLMLEKFAYKNATHIIALSEDMAKGVADTGVDVDKITVIPNSADLELFDPEQIPVGLFSADNPELPCGPIVLYPGTMGKVNGVSYLVDLAGATCQLREDILFIVIGDGVEYEQVRARAVDNGTLGRNFFLFPPMPKKKLVTAFRDSSIVISLVIDVPALDANSANKIFDGLAAGRPIAINHGGWQKDLIIEEGLGLVLPRDIDAAALALTQFLNDSDRVFESGKNARRVAVERFSRDRLARKLEAVLISALKVTKH